MKLDAEGAWQTSYQLQLELESFDVAAVEYEQVIHVSLERPGFAEALAEAVAAARE